MDKSVANLRPTTAEDIKTLYGIPLQVTVHGITSIEDGRVLGFGAIFPSDGCMVLIFRLAEDARQEFSSRKSWIKTMLVGARKLLQVAAENRLPVRTVADRKYPRSVELIEHLGFRHIEKDVYEWTIQA